MNLIMKWLAYEIKFFDAFTFKKFMFVKFRELI